MVKAASAIILKNKKILLIKRSKNSDMFPDCWACPGGRAKKGETAKQAVIREAKEEVNIDFRPTRLFKKGKYKSRILFRFLGTWRGKVKVQEREIDRYKWASYKEAVKLKLGFDYYDIIENLHKKKLI